MILINLCLKHITILDLFLLRAYLYGDKNAKKNLSNLSFNQHQLNSDILLLRLITNCDK